MRTTRAIASLIHSLMLGSTATVTAVVLSTAVVGCKDESQPEYWVEKLEDPSWRARSVNRLAQFFEDAVTRANKDMKAPDVQDLINKTVEPLTKLYVEQYDMLDSKTRVALIKLLADYRDKRAEPALKKAFEAFAKAPKSSKDESDIKWAARANEDLKSDALSVPMLEAFLKLKASSMLGGVVYKDLNKAMLVQPPNKAWVGPLVQKLDAEVTVPKNNKDKSLFDDYRDQLFWQTTSAEVLGRIGDGAAAEPLIKVLLDPSKGDVQATALLALVKLGKPAAELATKLLKGEAEKLQTFQLRRIKEVTGQEVKGGSPHVQTAALILGTIGRQDSIPAMIAALQSEKDDSTKAVIARELTKLPATPESKEAFKQAYASLPLDATMPPAGSAVEALTEASGQFFDASMVDWLLETAGNLKGEADDRKAIQSTISLTALKLAKPDQLPAVKAAIERYGTKLEKDLFEQVQTLVTACSSDAGCYLTALTKSENQDQSKQFVGIKAGYMLAVLGNEQIRDKLVDSLGSINNAALRYVSAQVIDKLSPKGSKAVSEKLARIIETNDKSADREKAAGDSPLKQVMYRLDARG